MIERSDPPPDLSRLRALFVAISLVMAVIVVRLWYLQIVKGPEFAEIADTQRTRLIRRAAARGAIVDSRGRPLATSRPQFVVSIIPDEARKSPITYTRLAAMLHTTEDALHAQIAATTKHDRLAPSDPVPVVKDAGIDLLSQVEEQRVDLPGILITRDPVRCYVDNQTCTHLLGIARAIDPEELAKVNRRGGAYHGGDVIGKEGLEKSYEDELRGTDGGQWISVTAHGRIEHVLDEAAPVPGHTLRLTIDGDLQRTAYDALQEPLQQGHAGSAVAIDPNDGAVLAMVSTPSYDANTYTKKFKDLLANGLAPLICRATASGYPCGSTFKLVTSAAGLESGSISADARIFCPGYLQVGNRTFHCDKATGHGSLDLYDAIAQSCDVYFYQVARRVGTDGLVSWAHNFGLGEKTGIDLPAPMDYPGLVPSPAWKKRTKRGPWVPGDLVNMSIGQGAVLVTPMQLACYTAALANGGDLLTPQLVREIDDVSTGRPEPIKTLVRRRRGSLGISPEHRNAIVEGMRRAFETGGTAHVLAVPGMDVAGKTGSAQMIFNGHHRLNSVFVCFAPAEHPKIAIAVLVEGAGYGMEVAGPIARRMVSQYLHLNLTPVDMHVGRIHGGD